MNNWTRRENLWAIVRYLVGAAMDFYRIGTGKWNLKNA